MVASKVLVLNAGSSSLKFKLFDRAQGTLHAAVSGLIERIGDTANSQVSHRSPLTIPHDMRVPVSFQRSYAYPSRYLTRQYKITT